MKHTKLALFNLFIYTIFASSGCFKPDKIEYDNPFGLPNATQTGRNNFACMVNGKPWITKSSIFSVRATVTKDSTGASGSYGPDVYFQHFGFILKGNIPQINISHTISGVDSYFFLSGDHICTGYIGVYRFKGSGAVTITKVDTAAKILSGKFNCKIPIPNCDTLKMTDGRFDIRYK